MNVVFTISRIILVLFIASFGTLITEQARIPQRRQDNSRTCMNYGHACWGAHGKRSDNKNYIVRKLLPPSLRELNEPKALRYSETSHPLFASKLNDIRRQNFIKEYQREKEADDIDSNGKISNDDIDLLNYIRELLHFNKIQQNEEKEPDESIQDSNVN